MQTSTKFIAVLVLSVAGAVQIAQLAPIDVQFLTDETPSASPTPCCDRTELLDMYSTLLKKTSVLFRLQMNKLLLQNAELSKQLNEKNENSFEGYTQRILEAVAEKDGHLTDIITKLMKGIPAGIQKVIGEYVRANLSKWLEMLGECLKKMQPYVIAIMEKEHQKVALAHAEKIDQTKSELMDYFDKQLKYLAVGNSVDDGQRNEGNSAKAARIDTENLGEGNHTSAGNENVNMRSFAVDVALNKIPTGNVTNNNESGAYKAKRNEVGVSAPTESKERVKHNENKVNINKDRIKQIVSENTNTAGTGSRDIKKGKGVNKSRSKEGIAKIINDKRAKENSKDEAGEREVTDHKNSEYGKGNENKSHKEEIEQEEEENKEDVSKDNAGSNEEKYEKDETEGSEFKPEKEEDGNEKSRERGKEDEDDEDDENDEDDDESKSNEN